MTIEAIENLFKSRLLDSEQTARAFWVREAGLAFAQVIMRNTPDCADRSAAIRKIREAVFTANSAISMEERIPTIGIASAEVYA